MCDWIEGLERIAVRPLAFQLNPIAMSSLNHWSQQAEEFY